MDITFKTLMGNIKLECLSPSLQLDELKHLLRSKADHAVPLPEHQRLMLRAGLLGSGTLASAGVRSGDSIVVLAAPRPLPPPAPDRTTRVSPLAKTLKLLNPQLCLCAQTPSVADIKVAILAEAKRRGIEGQIRPDAPSNPRAARAYGLLDLASRDGLPDLLQMDGQLMQLIEVLQGRLTEARVAAMAPPVPEAPVVIPQPSAAALAQLTEMGFGEQISRNALLLQRNNVAAALDWLLQHGEEPEAAEPPSEERLQQIYGRPVRPAALSETDMVQQLVEMGFTGDQSEAALRRYRDIDLALAHLLRRSGVDLPSTATTPLAAAAAAAAPTHPAYQPVTTHTAAAAAAAAASPSAAPSSQRSPASHAVPSSSGATTTTPLTTNVSLAGPASQPGSNLTNPPTTTQSSLLASSLSASIASLRLCGSASREGAGGQQPGSLQVNVGSHALHAEGEEEEEFESSDPSSGGGFGEGFAEPETAEGEESGVADGEEEVEAADEDEDQEPDEYEEDDDEDYEQEEDDEDDDGDDMDGEDGQVDDLFFGSDAVHVLRMAGAQQRALMRAQADEGSEEEGMMMPMQAGQPLLMGLAPNPYDSGGAVFNTPPGSMEEDGGYGGSGWSERAHQAMSVRLQHSVAMAQALAQARQSPEQ